MSLNSLLAAALDRAVQALPTLQAFSRLKVGGPELRRYFHETTWYQREICLYRDKWWGREGGLLHGELFCLVNEVQMALAGQPQSLSRPDYAIPFHHFQFSLAEDQSSTWQIRSPDDVAVFENAIGAWLSETALPWFGQFEAMQGVHRFMQTHGHWLSLARLLHTGGDTAKARGHIATWLTGLPRDIEARLEELMRAGLLSADERRYLTRAALQEETRYRAAVEAWIAGPATR